MGRFLAVMMMLLAGATQLAAQDRPIKRDIPAEVAAHIDRAEGCLHWAGEEPYDAARRKQIESALARLRCSTLERDGAALKQRYRQDGHIVKALRSADWAER